MAFCFTRERTQVMGILNLTPDSFSDGGDYFLPEDALRRALELQAQGADILDLGAQSTRPGHSPLPSAEELNRLLPLLELLRGRLHIPISIDTFYPEVAQAALERGAAIINDVSGVVDVNMARVILRYNAGWVLMHNGGGADETQNYLPDVVCAVRTALEEMADAALRLGLKKEQICLDPGIGFGKSQADNLLLLKYTAQFSSLGFCVLVGA
ncbi:MAG: dihydropteroate synthase, partial [Oscillospiraceae bacterium]|nr:dihydropteroate synthase [Oscillospiraceae bacterium]